MTAPQNPERLWAFFVHGAPYAGTSLQSVEASTAFGWGATPVSEYVRKDVSDAAQEKTSDALVMARVQTAKAHGLAERAISAGEALLVWRDRAEDAQREAATALANLRRSRDMALTLANEMRLLAGEMRLLGHNERAAGVEVAIEMLEAKVSK